MNVDIDKEHRVISIKTCHPFSVSYISINCNKIAQPKKRGKARPGQTRDGKPGSHPPMLWYIQHEPET
jgi:hypothetical protein